VGDAYTFEPLAVDSLVEKALTAFRQRLLIDGFTVNINIPDDLPEVRADATAMGLVLVNVVDNAIRYSTHQKSLDISSVAAGNHVSLTIADSGDGIPEDEVRCIGRRFFRGRNAHSGGTGLGLALSKQIICDHAGSWSLTSVPGQGTAVTIQLPVA
jgi:signal transduction histidine kinase